MGRAAVLVVYNLGVRSVPSDTAHVLAGVIIFVNTTGNNLRFAVLHKYNDMFPVMAMSTDIRDMLNGDVFLEVIGIYMGTLGCQYCHDMIRSS